MIFNELIKLPISCIGTYSHTDIPQTVLTCCALETERVFFFTSIFQTVKKDNYIKRKKLLQVWHVQIVLLQPQGSLMFEGLCYGNFCFVNYLTKKKALTVKIQKQVASSKQESVPLITL